MCFAWYVCRIAHVAQERGTRGCEPFLEKTVPKLMVEAVLHGEMCSG